MPESADTPRSHSDSALLVAGTLLCLLTGAVSSNLTMVDRTNYRYSLAVAAITLLGGMGLAGSLGRTARLWAKVILVVVVCLDLLVLVDVLTRVAWILRQ